MKLFTFLSLSLFLAKTTTCQINKGQFLAGGNISFQSVKEEETNIAAYKTTDFFFSPDIGYFVLPKFAAGLRFDLMSYKETSPASISQTNISVSPFLRYYFLPRKQKFNILADLGYVHLSTKFKTLNSTPGREQANGYNISAGPAVFLNGHVALEFLLGYKYIKPENRYDLTTTSLNTSLGLQIHLGRLKAKAKG